MFNKEKLFAIAFILIIGNLIHCNVQDNNVTRRQLFDLNWKFNYGNNISAYKADFNDENWRNIDLPHIWGRDTELFRLTSDSVTDSVSMDSGWYRKQFEIPELWLHKTILIDFEGICVRNEIFVNGISVKGSGEGKTSFQAKLNPYLNSGGNNVIAIHVTIPKKTGDTWSSDSGIYNHVWLIVKDTPGFKE